ncbi:hypothetical protein BH10BDE1_BH10BDE1_28000 [soil metagenome]
MVNHTSLQTLTGALAMAEPPSTAPVGIVSEAALAQIPPVPPDDLARSAALGLARLRQLNAEAIASEIRNDDARSAVQSKREDEAVARERARSDQSIAEREADVRIAAAELEVSIRAQRAKDQASEAAQKLQTSTTAAATLNKDAEQTIKLKLGFAYIVGIMAITSFVALFLLAVLQATGTITLTDIAFKSIFEVGGRVTGLTLVILCFLFPSKILALFGKMLESKSGNNDSASH